MPTHKLILNGEHVSVDCANDVRLLWVLRDHLGVHGPKYGCGLEVCKACTSHINGRAFNPCAVPVSKLKPTDEIATIEGLAATVGESLHPMQQAWLDFDVSQCGYCQPGQIMHAVALVDRVHAEGRHITEADVDSIRDVCRCGTYFRIREAITAAAAEMAKHESRGKKKHTTAITRSTAHPRTIDPPNIKAPELRRVLMEHRDPIGVKDSPEAADDRPAPSRSTGKRR